MVVPNLKKVSWDKEDRVALSVMPVKGWLTYQLIDYLVHRAPEEKPLWYGQVARFVDNTEEWHPATVLSLLSWAKCGEI